MVQNQDFSGENYFFLTCQEVKYLTFTNLAGVSFRENWNPTGVRFGDFFFWNFVWQGLFLKKKTSPYKNFQNFGIFCDFFLSTVSIEKCLFGLINGMIFFSDKKKKWMLDSKIFTFFKPKNDLFGEFLDPTYFWPQKKFLGTFFL